MVAVGIAPQHEDISLIMKQTQKYIESIEWDVDFVAKANKFAPYKQVYMQKLNSRSPQDVFLAAVMLGILKAESAVPTLKKMESDSTLVKIGVSFALCMLLRQDYDIYKKYLMETGKITQDVGGATSLKYLEAVELLSLSSDEGFIEYTNKLKTDEAYQIEAIEVAVERYKKKKK